MLLKGSSASATLGNQEGFGPAPPAATCPGTSLDAAPPTNYLLNTSPGGTKAYQQSSSSTLPLRSVVSFAFATVFDAYGAAK